MRLAQAMHAADLARAEAAYRKAAGGVPRPMHADWVWRPAPWTEAIACPDGAAPPDGTEWSAGIKFCHDAKAGASGAGTAPALLQAPAAAGAPAPFRVRVDCAGLGGASYASLVFGLPRAVLDGLGRGHVITLHTVIEPVPDVPVFARLNLRSGPNCPQIAKRLRLPAHRGPVLCEFDLHGIFPAVRGVDHIWCDLIFARPGAARVGIDDVSFARRPRARF